MTADFGFVAAPVERPGTPDARLYSEILADCEAHRALGFGTVWLLEHHFSDYFPMPSPLVALSHIAGRFPDLALGTCVLVTPWYDPLRLAGEIAMLTHLARRPIHLGLGRGTAKYEYDAFGLEMREARDRFRECWEILDLALAGEPFSFQGRYLSVPKEIRIRPRPVRDRVTFYGAIGTAPSAPLMAEMGLPPICTSIGDFEQQAATLRAWEGRAAELGVDASSVRPILANAIVADTDGEALAQAKRYMTRYMAAQVRHYEADATRWGGIAGYEQWGAVFARMKALCEPAAIGSWAEYQLIGSAETVAEKTQRLLDCGFNHLIVHTSTPEVPRAVRHEWSARFAREVAPRFSSHFRADAVAAGS
jgi:alkanesulfonate monooxygenase SsuD/methylene tetrahydromethanopterin reductase-like flavin-dependent oxidoreductase (luciferase family)